MTDDALTGTLLRLQRRLRFARAVEAALRWSLYASVLACALLVISRLASLPAAPVAAVIVLPVAAALIRWLRPVPLRDCAALVDGSFRLDERVTTAVEAAGPSPMAQAVREDASRALGRVDALSLGRLRRPREAAFIAFGLVLALALLALPARRPAAVSGLELEAVGAREAERLMELARDPRLAAHAAALERIAERLRTGRSDRMEEALKGLRAIETALGRESGGEGLSASRRQALLDLADRLAASGAAIGRDLAGAGIEIQDRIPVSVEARLQQAARAAAADRSARPEPFDFATVAPSGSVSLKIREASRRALARRGWEPRYDAVVRRYFEDAP